MEKRLPQLYYIKMKISYDLCFIMLCYVLLCFIVFYLLCFYYVFYLSLCFSVPEGFLENRLRELVPAIIASIMAKLEQIL